MTVTSQLLQLFRVDQQLRGLRSRLETAERFLAQQQRQLKELETLIGGVDLQLKQLRVSVADGEGEAARLEARMATLREQMNSAKTSKEYNAFLSELGTFKDSKGEIETDLLESMSKIEELERQTAEARAQRTERKSIVAKAAADRDAKEAEIKDRLAELTAQRAEVAKDIPRDALAVLETLIKQRGDGAMAHVEVVDRRSHEYSCASCMMTLPIETVNNIVNGRLVRCVSCSCLLFTEEELVRPKTVAKAR